MQSVVVTSVGVKELASLHKVAEWNCSKVQLLVSHQSSVCSRLMFNIQGVNIPRGYRARFKDRNCGTTIVLENKPRRFCSCRSINYLCKYVRMVPCHNIYSPTYFSYLASIKPDAIQV